MVTRFSYLTKAKAAVGTTTGTEEKIDDITTPADTSDVLAYIVQDANDGTSTAAEAHNSRFRVQPRTLANQDLYPPAPSSYGGAPATNIEALVVPAHAGFHPFLPKSQQGGMGNKKITFYFEQTGPEATADFAGQASVLSSNGGYPADVMQNVGRVVTRYSWSDSVQQDDVKATSQAFTNNITVPGFVREIVAIQIQLALDAAPTASEDFLGYLQLGGTVPGVNGFCEVPFSSISGSLGTPVGGYVSDSPGTILPLYIDMSSITSDSTISFTSKALHALSGAVSCQVTLYGR